MPTKNAALARWVDEVARLTTPDRIHWCDGSEAEYQQLIATMLADGTLEKLNETTHPNCYLHRSHPSDVARVEHLTFVCTKDRDAAGPNNHWLAPAEAHAKIDALFAGCMKGRTLYVIPYCMGPIDSPYARCGVEITDSAYVVANMRIMTRMGAPALTRIEREGGFVKGLHSTGDLSPDRRFIMHFPEELSIKSIGSGYGGNALLGKKCHALRIASWQAREEGWLAEHMLIVGIEDPQGRRRYVAAAFPSACGKTNLAMLIPPKTMPGWKVWTVGDDIAWLHFDDQGQLRAINPESGYFGVVPGTNTLTNKNAHDIIQSDTIFTNVAVTADHQPWWEGLHEGTPVTDWKGQPWDGKSAAAHPNSRFTVSAKRNPCYAPEADDPRGVPISALIFGGRRKEVAPLVFQAKSWSHGVLVAAGVASETTAAAAGQVGVVRRDSMAMKPFCGYNFGDYFGHWLAMGARSAARNGTKLPEIFHVNWFRQGPDGKFLWPGFGENLRVVEWMLERCEGKGAAVETPIGWLPTKSALDLDGLDIPAETLDRLLSVDHEQWRREIADIRAYLDEFGSHTPQALKDEADRVAAALR